MSNQPRAKSGKRLAPKAPEKDVEGTKRQQEHVHLHSLRSRSHTDTIFQHHQKRYATPHFC